MGPAQSIDVDQLHDRFSSFAILGTSVAKVAASHSTEIPASVSMIA
jgi:hypothetical protein